MLLVECGDNLKRFFNLLKRVGYKVPECEMIDVFSALSSAIEEDYPLGDEHLTHKEATSRLSQGDLAQVL